MKCVSCESEINPKWKHAVESNSCPFCGKDIMEEHLKNLLSSLCDTMDKLCDYPDQINDWMLSNYNFIKTDSPDLPLYLPKDYMPSKPIGKKQTIKVKTDQGEEEVQVEKIKSEEETSEFFKRAEVKMPTDKSAHFRNIVKQIKNGGTAVIEDDGEESVVIEGAGGSVPSEEEVAELQSAIDSGNGITSALQQMSDGDDDIPSVVLSMANKAKAKGTSNASDLIKLQQMQEKVLQSRNNFNFGGGKFSRAG